jgi:hypothetical protein
VFRKNFPAQLREENFAKPGELDMGQNGAAKEWMYDLDEYFYPSHGYWVGEWDDILNLGPRRIRDRYE